MTRVTLKASGAKFLVLLNFRRHVGDQILNLILQIFSFVFHPCLRMHTLPISNEVERKGAGGEMNSFALTFKQKSTSEVLCTISVPYFSNGTQLPCHEGQHLLLHVGINS